MPPRLPQIKNESDAITSVLERLDKIEDSLTERLLPPGFKVNLVAGNIVVTNKGDGTTSTLVFA